MNLSKKGITLLALVITIIIMLLLAGVVIQMAVGENGLFVKATQSKQEQAKSELYETAKLEYLGLKTKAIEQGQQDPPVSAVLSATNFLAKYDLDGSNIKDKKGEIIDTRDNLLDKLEGMSSSDVPIEPSPQTYPEQSYPKTIDGVTIQEYDKDKMILKIKIKEQTKLAIRQKNYIPDPYNVEVEWGNWGYNTFKPGYVSEAEHQYSTGEYTMKIKGAKSFSLESAESRNDKFEVTVLHWGKFESDLNEQNEIRLMSVKDIKMPEPNDVTVEYNAALIANIPEDLFKYKPTRKKISFFKSCPNITGIPEDLYKYNTGMTELYDMFNECNNLATIPEGLFKYNKNVTKITGIFSFTKITTIPENLFKYNKEVVKISGIFQSTNITTIPENIFKYNTKLNNVIGLFSFSSVKTIPENIFKYNTEIESFDRVFTELHVLESIPENIFSNNKKAKSFQSAFRNNLKLKTIPENLFKNNTEVESFSYTFQYCKEIKTIPENLFKNNTEVESFSYTFQNCEQIETIPENLFKYNTKAKNFECTFYYLKKIETIPENLFKYNTEALNFNHTFSYCEKLTNISNYLFQNNNKSNTFYGTFYHCTSLTYLNLPLRLYSVPESQYRGIFRGCTNAYNYGSAPESWK